MPAVVNMYWEGRSIKIGWNIKAQGVQQHSEELINDKAFTATKLYGAAAIVKVVGPAGGRNGWRFVIDHPWYSPVSARCPPDGATTSPGVYLLSRHPMWRRRRLIAGLSVIGSHLNAHTDNRLSEGAQVKYAVCFSFIMARQLFLFLPGNE